MASQAIRVDGLKDLQRDLKQLQPAARKDITKALREGAKLIHRTGRPYVAQKSGRLARGWRPGATQMQGFVRNREPYAGIQEYGGTIRPKGAAVEIRAKPSMTRALEQRQEALVDSVGDAVEDAARRYGW
jgi:phage gpG-like protein